MLSSAAAPAVETRRAGPAKYTMPSPTRKAILAAPQGASSGKRAAPSAFIPETDAKGHRLRAHALRARGGDMPGVHSEGMWVSTKEMRQPPRLKGSQKDQEVRSTARRAVARGRPTQPTSTTGSRGGGGSRRQPWLYASAAALQPASGMPPDRAGNSSSRAPALDGRTSGSVAPA